MTATTPASAKFCALILLFLTLALTTFAQSQATTGDIEGRVLDPKSSSRTWGHRYRGQPADWFGKDGYI